MIFWNILFLVSEILVGIFFNIDIFFDKMKLVDEVSRWIEGKKVYNVIYSYMVRRIWRVFFLLFKYIFDWYFVFREYLIY